MAQIGIDLDGVLFDFAANLRDYLYSNLGWKYSDCPDPTRWEFYEDWGFTEKGFRIICDRAASEGFLFATGRPLDDVQILANLKAAGHSLHIVTDRFFGPDGGQSSQRATVNWLANHKIPYDTITFARDKTVVRLDYMIDDKPANCVALGGVGCHAYLRTQPWNESFNYPNRVSGLAEFAEEVFAGE